MKFNLILSCFVAILALVNPIQKVLIVTSLQERFSPTELRYISIKSTITAMLILIFFLYLGQVMKVDEHIKIADLTTVPIAIPMIAGPATITAAVTFPVQYSRFVTIVAILLA